MKKTKILHITFDMTIGGAQQVIRQLVENMDGDKFSSDIVCIDNRLGELGETVQKLGVNVHLLDRQKGFDFSLIRQLYKLIKKNGYDVVHCHQYSPYIYGLLGALLTSARVIFTEHGRFYPDYGTWKRQLINPIFSLFTSQITAISQATKDALIKYEHFKNENIDVIYNGVVDKSNINIDEVALKNEFDIPLDCFIYGTISRLQPIKNQEMMLKAFEKVMRAHSNTHLIIVGDGEIKGALEALVKELGMSNHVTFTGFQNDPYKFHKIIDVFLLSSFSEGASMTLLEAMSFSTPCVVTEVGGSAELIINNENGIVVPSDQINDFSLGMIRLIDDKSFYKHAKKMARHYYQTKFTVEQMIKQFSALSDKKTTNGK